MPVLISVHRCERVLSHVLSEVFPHDYWKFYHGKSSSAADTGAHVPAFCIHDIDLAMLARAVMI
jgi:hypothetical protein